MFSKKNHFNYKHNLYLIDVLSPHIYIFISKQSIYTEYFIFNLPFEEK